MKGYRTQGELGAVVGIRQGRISNFESGKKEPTIDELRALRDKLECTGDFLIDPPTDPSDERQIVSLMAFNVFAIGAKVKPHQRERCRRVLGYEAAPVTAESWRHLAEMIDSAVPPSEPPNLQLVEGVKAG